MQWSVIALRTLLLLRARSDHAICWPGRASMLRLFFATALLACTVRAADGQEPDFDDYFRFVTRPDIEAPKWDITIYDEDRLQIANEGQANYHWFVAPYDDLEQKVFPKWNGPLIYDTQGDLIWSGAPDRNYSNTYDFRVSQVDGKPMLSFLTIKGTDGQSGFILDDSYQIHAQVDTRGDLPDSNMHEFNVVDNGHSALVVANPGIDPVPITIPSRNGSAAWNGTCRIRQEGFREVDVQTGRVNFEFSPLGRVKAKEHTYMDTDIGAWKDRCSQNFGSLSVPHHAWPRPRTNVFIDCRCLSCQRSGQIRQRRLPILYALHRHNLQGMRMSHAALST